MLKKYAIFIIGLGQIGGSLGYALIRDKHVAELSGYDISNSVRKYALKNGIVHRTADTINHGIVPADIVILATPIRATVEILSNIAPKKYRDKIFIDVCGVKNEIISTVKKLGIANNYVSCHPMTGTEQEGIAAASKDLFKEKNFIICPLSGTRRPAIDTARQIIQSIGARPIVLDPDKHDQLIALTSHLPHILALALARLADNGDSDNDLFNLIGGSFKSSTRVACSSPQLIRDMLLSNRDNAVGIIDRYIDELAKIRTLLGNNDETRLGDLIHKTRAFCRQVHHG